MNKTLVVIGTLFGMIGLALMLFPETIEKIPLSGLGVHQHDGVEDLANVDSDPHFIHGLVYAVGGFGFAIAGWKLKN